MVPGFAGLFARLLARATSVFPGVLPCDILGSFSVATALGAVTTETPQWQKGRRGGIQIEPKALFSLRTLTLYLRRQSSPFLGAKSRLGVMQHDA